MKNLRACFIMTLILLISPFLVYSAEMGKFSYGDFEQPKRCGMCHKEIHQEWQQSLMSQSFTHEWDQVEYFKLALPHALKLQKVSGIKGDCIACHGPLAFLSGDIPPKPAEAGTRANEGVSCEICHNITGTTEEVPFNFSFIIEPDKVKQGPRGDAKSPAHDVKYSEFTISPELCATCHDEQSPYGAWVKTTYREWKASPHANGGKRCQDCHMYHAPGKSAFGGKERADMAHHNFHGSHFPSKLAGTVDLALYTKNKEITPGSKLELRAELFNGKAGHYIPSGSTEERMLWMEVWAIDAMGKHYPIPVDPKGFHGEEYTIADPKAMAYQAMGEIMEIKDFEGLKRDGNVQEGARIFRRPFLDPKGRMTICQWYTENNTLVDYRIGPMETKIENYTWSVPAEVASGQLTIKASLFFSQVPSSVGEFLELPAFEYEPIPVNTATLILEAR